MPRAISGGWWSVLLSTLSIFGMLPFAGPSPAFAQDSPPPAAKATTEPAPAAPRPSTMSPAAFLPKELRQTLGSDERVSLKELVRLLSEQGIAAVLDKTLLDTPEFVESPSVVLRPDLPVFLLLDQQLTKAELLQDWSLDRGIVRIAPVDLLNQRLTTEYYDVADLKAFGALRDLVQELPLVTGGEESGPWVDWHGSGGSIQLLGDTLVVRQTFRVQLELKCLLDALRREEPEVYVAVTEEDLALQQALRNQRVTADFDGVPLQKVLRHWQEETGLPIDIDQLRAADRGIRIDEPCHLRLPELPLEQTLEILLSRMNLDAIVANGRVLVTSEDYASERLHIVVYDVRDILTTLDDMTPLVNAIENHTGHEAYGPWVNVHGNGGNLVVPLSGKLVVRQTQPVLEEIHNLITARRTSLRKHPLPKPVDPNRVISRYYRVPDQTADDLLTFLPASVRPGTWLGQGSGSFGATEADEADVIVGAIHKVRVGISWSGLERGAEDLSDFGFGDGDARDSSSRTSDPAAGSGFGFFFVDPQGASPSPAASSGAANPGMTVPTTSPVDWQGPSDAVLVIRHRASVHQEIEVFLNTLLFENPQASRHLERVVCGTLPESAPPTQP